jgi:hypothetical protein
MLAINNLSNINRIIMDGETITPLGDSFSFNDTKEHTLKIIYNNDGVVPAEAFMNSCVRNVIFNKTINKIERKAFENCTQLNKIECQKQIAPTLSEPANTFKGVQPYGQIILPNTNSGYSTWLTNDAYGLGYYHWSNEELLVCKFNVKTTTAETKICHLTDSFDAIVVDGIAIEGESLTTGYTFATTGIHTVKYKVKNNRLEGEVFIDCTQMVAVNIPSHITSISGKSFINCNIKILTVDKNNPVYDSRDNCNAIIKTATNVLVVGGVFTLIPDEIGVIGEHAFHGREISSIILPPALHIIKNDAFRNSHLTSIVIPDSVTVIEENAFSICFYLEYIVLGESVQTIGDKAFFSCRDLTKIKCLGTTAPLILADTFRNISSGGTLAYLEGSDYSSWLSENEYRLGYYDWKGEVCEPTILCTFGLRDYIFKHMYSNEFSLEGSGFEDIAEVELNDLIPDTGSTGDLAMIDDVKEMYIDGVKLDTPVSSCLFTNVGSYVVEYVLTGDTVNKFVSLNLLLNTIKLPNTITTIKEAAFSGPLFLKSIQLSKSITTIENLAMIGIGYTTSIIVDKENPIFDSRDNCNAIIDKATNTLIVGCNKTVIPTTVEKIGAGSFYALNAFDKILTPSSAKLLNIVLPNSITHIEEGAFTYAYLKSPFVIPQYVANIGAEAFAYNTVKEYVAYPTIAPIIDATTFLGASEGGTLYYPKGSDYSQWLSKDSSYLGSANWKSKEF